MKANEGTIQSCQRKKNELESQEELLLNNMLDVYQKITKEF